MGKWGADINLIPTSESKKKVFRLDFDFTPAQKAIESSSARFKIVRAGRKFGKTTYAQKKALDWISKPYSIHWQISPTYHQAKLISWSEFKRLIPPEALGKKPNDTDLVITLKNGSQLFLMGSDDPDSLRGPAPTSVCFEEAAFHKREAWYEVVRPNLMPKKAPALFIGTPKGFNWFYDLEQEAKRLIQNGNKDWATFHYSVYDNPHIDRQEIEDARRGCDTNEVWRQEYLAEFESSVGRVFSTFSDLNHVRKIELPSGVFTCWRSVDWGMRDDTAVLWAFIRGNKLHIYREYAENNMSAPAQAQVVKNQTTGREKVAMTAISHDAAKEDPAMKGLTVMWHFRQAGITPLRPSSRDKKHSRQMIQQLLHENRIVIDSEKCQKLRKQIMAYEWKDTANEKPEDTGNDDLVDSLHYLVELLQFELFMGKTKSDDDKTTAEVMASIAQEKLEQQRSIKITVPTIFKRDDGFSDQFQDTSAGYL